MIDFETIKIGKVIERLRRQKGWSQEEFAQYCDKERKTISAIENDISKPSFETFVTMANVFDIYPSDLMLEIEKDTYILDFFKHKEK